MLRKAALATSPMVDFILRKNNKEKNVELKIEMRMNEIDYRGDTISPTLLCKKHINNLNSSTKVSLPLK